MATREGSADQPFRIALGAAALAITAAGALALPQQAGANHGVQGNKFKNKDVDNAHSIVIKYDRPLSHVSKHTWPQADCKLADGKTRIVCEDGDPLARGKAFKVWFATPPPASTPPSYVEADLVKWYWLPAPRRGDVKDHKECRHVDGCDYLETQVPAPPGLGRPAGP